MSLSEVYGRNELERVPIRGDGHCIVQSVRKCLENLNEEKRIPTKKEMLDDIRKAFQEGIEYYGGFIDCEKTDPVAEMDDYILHGTYNTDISDLILQLISNQFTIRIAILHYDRKDQAYKIRNGNYVLTPNDKGERDLNYQQTIYLQKRGSHYNALKKVVVHESDPGASLNGQSGRRDSGINYVGRSGYDQKHPDEDNTKHSNRNACLKCNRIFRNKTGLKLHQKVCLKVKVGEESVINSAGYTSEPSLGKDEEEIAEVDDFADCPKCKEEFKNGVYCVGCMSWYHYQCEKTLKIEVEIQFASSEYLCMKCRDKTVYQVDCKESDSVEKQTQSSLKAKEDEEFFEMNLHKGS